MIDGKVFDELVYLDAGLHQLVDVEPLGSAKLAWVNPRYDVLDQRGVMRACAEGIGYEEYILKRCAIRVSDVKLGNSPSSGHAYADRYGGNSIGANGGAGRSIFIDDYYLKGVGRTPLVGLSGWEFDADGQCTLEEAFREVVFSRIVERDFPHSAVPVLAVLVFASDASQVRPNRVGSLGFKAIVVRPRFARLAHFERALGFVGSPRIEQRVQDAKRVEKIVRSAWATASADLPDLLQKLSVRWFRQIAWGFVWRIHHGDPSSSNIAFDGRLLDFGATTAVPGWFGHSNSSKWNFLDQQIRRVEAELSRVCYYFSEYAPAGFIGAVNLSAYKLAGRRAFASMLVTEFLGALGVRKEVAESLAAAEFAPKIAECLFSFIEDEQGFYGDMLDESVDIWRLESSALSPWGAMRPDIRERIARYIFSVDASQTIGDLIRSSENKCSSIKHLDRSALRTNFLRATSGACVDDIPNIFGRELVAVAD